MAILRKDADFPHFAAILARASGCVMSSVNFMETNCIVAGRTAKPDIFGRLDSFMAACAIDIVPHDRLLAYVARDAFLLHGRGRHPASLNLGDCAAYALAKTRGLPLLFKRNGFAQTDLVAAA